MATIKTTEHRTDIADLVQAIGFMSDDDSNNWSAEVKVLEAAETELEDSRAELAAFRKAFGPVQEIEELAQFMKLGRFTAALLGAYAEWPGTSPMEWIAEEWSKLGHEHPIGDQNEAAFVYWRELADSLRIEHDGQECDYDDCPAYVPENSDESYCQKHADVCDNDDCEESTADGEGYAGLCGNCADRAEAGRGSSDDE